MAREYWYMQLRRCVMCSSIWSLIASVLSDQKPLLTPGKRLGGGASAVEHTEFRGCYKVGSPVAVPANATRETRPVAYPVPCAPTPRAQRVIRRTYAAVKPAVLACVRRAAASAFDV